MLGRGLESLIPNKNQAPDTAPERKLPLTQPRHDAFPAVRQNNAEAIFHIEVDKVKPNPHQPRKTFDETQLAELAASIREVGIIQPLIVTKRHTETAFGTDVEYQLIAGERRLMAAKLAGLERVPAIVRAVPEEKEKLELAIVENVQRADLNPIDAARSYAKLQEEFGLTQREVASRVGKSRETIANAVRLLNLPTPMQDAIARNALSESQGRVLLGIADAAQQHYVFEQVVNNNMSVRELKNTIARMNRAPSFRGRAGVAAAFASNPEDNALELLARELESALKTRVRIERIGEKSKLTIDFSSEGDLRKILTKLME